MAKRSATSELNHDNWDDEEEQEEAGTFRPLGASELQNRVIRKARRSLGNRESPGSSPFAAFSGFTTSSSSDPFSFLKKSSNTAEGSSMFKASSIDTEKNENGGTASNDDKKVEKVEKAAHSNISSSTTVKEKSARSIEYYRQLQSLNESILKWMQLHLSNNACCDFTPVFNDYQKHLDTLNVTYPVKNKDSILSEGKKDVFKKPSSNSPSVTKNANSTNVQSSFKLSSKHDDETEYGAHFSSNTTNTSTFSFGCKSTPTALSTGSLPGPTTSLKKEDDKKDDDKKEDAEKKPFQFSFSRKPQSTDSLFANKPFSFSTASMDTNASSDGGGTEESEYVPPKNDFTAVSEQDAVYSKRCKLFYKKNDEYVERGVGILHLKPLDGKTQLLIRADTNLGNVLLNIILSASLPMSRTGKNNVLLVCVPNPPLDVKNPDSKEAIPILIRVKTSEDADELLDNLKKLKS